MATPGPDPISTNSTTHSTTLVLNRSFIYRVTAVAALGGLLFGFDIAIISGAIPFIETYFGLNQLQLGWAVSSLLLGAIAGSLVTGSLADRHGRRRVLFGVAFLFAASSVGTAIATHFSVFLVARIAGGLAVGAASIVSPLYIAEMAPASNRGRLVSLYQLSIVVGILLSYCINYLLHDTGNANWRWMFASGIIPSLLLLLTLFAVPETPRWLLTQGRSAEALRILTRLGGDAYGRQELEAVGQSLHTVRREFGELLHPSVRAVLGVGIALAFFVQASGINTVIDYAPIILKSAGWNIDAALFSTFVIGLVNLIFTLVGVATIDRFGRRGLYLVGSAGMAIMLALMTILQAIGQFSGTPVLLLILAYIACFAACIGPSFWTLVSEIFPTKIRGMAMSVAVFTNWVVNFLVVLFFPWLLQQAGGVFTFGLLTVMAALMFVFSLRFLPETKGKSLEAIEELF